MAVCLASAVAVAENDVVVQGSALRARPTPSTHGNRFWPGVELVLEQDGDDHGRVGGNYTLFYGEKWNGHELYVNTDTNRILMFDNGRWVAIGFQHWPGGHSA